ncbi:phosphotransferase [bacterium]|nr:phosphotransferase [bacterium]
MRPSDEQLRAEFCAISGSPISNLRSIAENKYCLILQAERLGRPVVFKKYLSGREDLALIEYQSINLYHSIASDDPFLIDGEAFGHSASDRTVGMTFIEGQRLSDHLRSLVPRVPTGSWTGESPALPLMEKLGGILAKLRSSTRNPGSPLDPFHAEYIRYASQRLRELPFQGRLLFRHAVDEAERLIDAIGAASVIPSFCHGDFVFRNIHTDGRRVGLIDFANSQFASHPLNDMVNLWMALQNMLLPSEFKDALWTSFCRGYGEPDFGPVEEEFFFEYHRRRWLMLNFTATNPLHRLRAYRGYWGFARPYSTRGGRLFA